MRSWILNDVVTGADPDPYPYAGVDPTYWPIRGVVCTATPGGPTYQMNTCTLLPPGDVKYDLSKILKKFMQLRHCAIFQVLMESESVFRLKEGLENGSAEN